MIYTVTFNPAIDYVVHLPQGLKLGEINRNRAEEFQWGGKGINVSVVLQCLSYPSTALGFVAGFTGMGLEQGLKAQGVNTDFIHLDHGMTRINVKVKADEETEINGMGPDIRKEDMDKLYAKLDTIPSGSILVLAGSIPFCLPSDTYERILERLSGKDIRVVVDAEKDLLVKSLAYEPFLIKPNLSELSEVVGKELHTEDEIIAAAVSLQEKGAGNVLVSLAGDGAILVDETGMVHVVKVPSGTVVNSVGAGDSMVAGFLAGWLETKDYEYALKLGTAAGSATAFSIGLCDKETVGKLLKELM